MATKRKPTTRVGWKEDELNTIANELLLHNGWIAEVMKAIAESDIMKRHKSKKSVRKKVTEVRKQLVSEGKLHLEYSGQEIRKGKGDVEDEDYGESDNNDEDDNEDEDEVEDARYFKKNKPIHPTSPTNLPAHHHPSTDGVVADRIHHAVHNITPYVIETDSLLILFWMFIHSPRCEVALEVKPNEVIVNVYHYPPANSLVEELSKEFELLVPPRFEKMVCYTGRYEIKRFQIDTSTVETRVDKERGCTVLIGKAQL